MSAQPHPLIEACWKACYEHGDIDRVRDLLEQGVDIDEPASCGAVPLDAALWGGHEALARFLVERGADVNAVGYDGYTVLMAACRSSAAIAELLIERGADPNLPSPITGETPLHAVASKGFEPHATQVVRLLLEAGADPNVRTKSGAEGCVYPHGSFFHVSETPLHLAAAYGDPAMMHLLVDAGADIGATDDNGDTPYQWFGRQQRDQRHIRVGKNEVTFLSP